MLHYSVIVCSFFSLFCEFSRTKEKNEGQSVQSRWIVEILLGLHSRLIAGTLASLQSNWKTDFFYYIDNKHFKVNLDKESKGLRFRKRAGFH